MSAYHPMREGRKAFLLALEQEARARIFFNYKTVSGDIDDQVVMFEPVILKDRDRTSEKKIADDVAHREDKSVSRADTGVSRTKKSDGSYPMDSKRLHAWPADHNIIMARPDFISHPEKFATFFTKSFRGAVTDLLSAKEATAQSLRHQKIILNPSSLTSPGYKDTMLLLGNSCHTTIPFRAMGMITALENVRILPSTPRGPLGAGHRVGAFSCVPMRHRLLLALRRPDQ
ncbi:hypothetical protein DL767_008170 [Monosporascus sp. MG133]|nr:hypothetical protein DL767_008170 [Monosporascus sp. MG133]